MLTFLHQVLLDPVGILVQNGKTSFTCTSPPRRPTPAAQAGHQSARHRLRNRKREGGASTPRGSPAAAIRAGSQRGRAMGQGRAGEPLAPCAPLPCGGAPAAERGGPAHGRGGGPPPAPPLAARVSHAGAPRNVAALGVRTVERCWPESSWLRTLA